MRTYTAVCLLVFSAYALKGQSFINGQAARAVIGEYTFTYGGAIPGTYPTRPGQQILGGVSGLAWANGTLYVADSNRLGAIPQDHRVVMFNTGLIPAANADLTATKSYSSYSCNLCGFPAFNALGQPSFDPPPVPSTITDPIETKATTFTPGTNNTASTSNMQEPTAVATDGTVVAVADTDNNRVLIWKSPPTSLNQPADLVLGQPNFTTGSPTTPPTSSSLSGPQGVWIQNGKLFVADTQNFRILIWNSIPTSNNQPADVVLGQSNFNVGTQTACNITIVSTNPVVSAANELCNPVAVTSDGVHLFVADLGFNRVLIWNTIPTSNGQNADVVVGQPNMTVAVANNNTALCPNGSGSQHQCAATLDYPRYVLSDGVRLFIADGGNDRVLIYNTIPTSNGVSADAVLGEPDFQTDLAVTQNVTFASTTIDNTSGVDLTPTPTSLAYDGANLYVSDSTNNRVLVFTPGNTTLPNNSAVNWASETIRQEGVVTITGSSTGVNIVAGDTATVTIQGTAYTYTIVKADTLDTIAQALVKAINANNGDPNATAIFAGAGTGSLYLSSKGINLGFKTVSLAASVSNTANLTAIASGDGYLSAGTAATGAPGMLVEINGTNLSDVTGTPATATLTGTIPTSLGGAQVFMDGVAAPVFSAVSNQVVSQIPFNFTERNSTSIYVRTTHSDGSVTVTNATPVYIAPANPGLFDAPASPGQQRPWPATGAYHQLGNPQSVIDVEGTITAGNTVTISINSVGHTYTVQSGDTLASVVTGLVNAINNAPDPLATATAGTSFNRVIVIAKSSGAAGSGIPIATSVSSGSTTTLTAYTSATCCAVVSGSPITASNPAAPNETIVMSAAGLGQIGDINNNVIGVTTGLPYTGAVQNNVLSQDFVSATMGANTSQVVSAGLATGSYGVYQVQMIVPTSQASGTTQVSIAQNAYVSNIVTIDVGAANSNPNPPPVGSSTIQISVDIPAVNGAAVNGTTYVGGWAGDTKAAIASVTVSVDGTLAGTATYGMSRPDVCAHVSGLQGCPNVGWYYLLDTTQLADGTHNLQITATDANGNRLTRAGTFTTNNYAGLSPTHVLIDSPGSSQAPYQGIATFSGWALSDYTSIASVQVLIDGVVRGNAVYGDPRPDVCALYPKTGCPNVGWHILFDTSALSNGTHVFAVNVDAANGQRKIVANDFTVANWSTGNPVIINFDRPTKQSSAFSGIVNFGGWAVDEFSRFESVTASIDGAPYSGLSYGATRNDVCASRIGQPGCPNVGWNLLVDTTLLGDGTHTLAITAIPVSGLGWTATQTFGVSNMGLTTNPTRIFIDSPAPQAAAFSGIASFRGWAINDSSPVQTVAITIDGVARGFAQYGVARGDVCAAFPGRPGCPNVGWTYMLDTSTFTNGSHLMQVTSTTASGERATASTTFSIQNSAAVSPTTVNISEPGSSSNAYQGVAAFAGSAINNTAGVASITVTVDGYPYGSPTPSTGGPGVSVNWTYLINTAQFADGLHTFGVTATGADGTFAVASSVFTVANWGSPSPVRISIDSPSASSSNFSGVAGFGGWAIDQQSAIASVNISIDGIPYGTASYGGTRNDVCTVLAGYPGCPNVGWNFAVDTTYLANGTHTVSVTATTAAGQSSTMTSSFVVAN